MEKTALWRNFIEVKYGSSHYNTKSGRFNIHNNSHGPWKSILSTRDKVYEHVKPLVHNGRSTSFWEDEWMGNALQYSFPLLYHLTSKKKGAVADFWDSSSKSWLLYLRRALREDELEEWITLSQRIRPLIDETRLTNGVGNWKKTVYSRLNCCTMLSPFIDPTNKHLMNSIWSGRSPKKTKFFHLGAFSQLRQH